MTNKKTTKTKNLTESRGKKNKTFSLKAKELGLSIDPKYITLSKSPQTGKMTIAIRVPNGKKKYLNSSLTMTMVNNSEKHLLLVAEQLRDYILKTGKSPNKEVRSKFIKAVANIEQETIAPNKQRRKYKKKPKVLPAKNTDEEGKVVTPDLVPPEQESKSKSTPKPSLWKRFLDYIGW